MRYLVLGWLCLMLIRPVVVFGAAAQASPLQLTMEQAIAEGLKANPDLAAAFEVVESSRLKVKAARGSFLPAVTLQSSYTKYRQTGDIIDTDSLDRTYFTNSIRVSQPLFAGFAILNSYQKSRLQVDLDQARLDQTRLEFIMSLRQDFLQLLKLREDLATVNNEIERIDSQLRAVKVFYKAQMSPYNEVLSTETELTRAQTGKLKILNQIKNQVTLLNTYRAAPYNDAVDYIGNLRSYDFAVIPDEAAAIETALNRRPDLELARKSIALARKDIRAAYAPYYPKVTLDYTHQHQDIDYDDYVYSEASLNSDALMFNLQWNIFDGGTTTYTWKAARRHLAALEKSLENQQAQIKADISRAFNDISNAEKLIELALQARKSSQENYNMVAARYRTRIGTITDLFDAQYSLTRSESDISTAYMQYQLAKATLRFYLGLDK